MNNIAKHVLKFYKFTLLLWLVIAVILSFYAFNLPSKLKGDGFDMEGEYVKVQNELNSTFDFPKNTMVVLFDKKENETTSTFHKQIKAVLTDIMGSREKNTYGIFTRHLAEKIDGCIYFPQNENEEYTDERKYQNFDDVCDYICENASDGDLVITLGCGDVYKVAKMILKKLNAQKG